MVLELPPESWGDRLRRARLYGKRRYGYSYRELAEHVTTMLPITDRAIITLEGRREAPTFRRQRVIAALYALTMGYTPESLGLADADQLLRPYSPAGLAQLDPANWASRRRPADDQK